MTVAADLNIPVYYFYTSGACCLAQYLYFPTLHRTTTGSFKDMNTLIHSPGLPPIPSSELPSPLLDRTSPVYSDFLVFCEQLPKSAGIIVNTFDSLEPKAIKAITDGLCVPDRPTPPIYRIGPLIAAGGDGTHECLNWLDLQPSQSVVYLCFGSSVSFFSSDQLKEIATGLERSGQRFLWVVRTPPSNNKDDRFQPPPEPDLDLLLPEGFLDRTRDRGLVVKTWAPQVAVLNKESVGGFVTLRVVLVEEMKLALPMESTGGKVSATEVEKRVRQLMEDEGVREVAKARKEEAALAMSDGGPSRRALANLIASW
ncbi:hypothetical protein L6452_05223 [Arctium lappa]|uniref:Uncharacterized protein n=1 Tax=Arctium lappa TaxID=4217 RepID=A0ACB9EFT1_ARCLA|nr:hypothetical protein L6452_05223 [Arctium lappa]